MELNYQGENLLAGNIGYFFVALAFSAAFLASIAYLIGSFRKGWRPLARYAFAFHGIGVLGIVVTLFYLIQGHYYEYHYVWEHSSNDLPLRYMISCFWEGQEGSFLLWAFWHAVLGILLILSSKKWEMPVMALISTAQIMLIGMLLGLDLWGDEAAELGMNPFRLLRDHMEAPIFSDPHYLEKITDGSGLNPLLQNYWMVVHPPVLFLGFALCIVPFAFSFAGLLTGKLKEWIKPALPWTVIGVGILGIGILMGGAWAYEALSFGGFWAWDPVENAVLVPWLILTAALHTMLIYRYTEKGLLISHYLVYAAFILILYSTFLTRSGVLGDSSVHSFTDLGLSGQLMLFLFFFILLGLALLIYRHKAIPKEWEMKQYGAREIWMLLGAIFLMISAFQIIFVTSIPVYNNVLNLFTGITGKTFNYAPPVDAVAHYNSAQLPLAIVIGLLTGLAHYLKYRKTGWKGMKRMLFPAAAAIILTVPLAIRYQIDHFGHLLLTFSAIYTVIGNLDMIIPMFGKARLKNTGSSLAHIGFGFILLGAMISAGKREVVSINRMGYDYGKDFSDIEKKENVYLPKGKPVLMGGYLVTYLGDSVAEPNHYYKVKYEKFDAETGETGESFILTPNAQINPQMGGLVSNPSTRHRLTWDLYTHVTSVPIVEETEGFTDRENFKVKRGDSLRYKGYLIVVGGINPRPELPASFKDTASVIATSIPLEVIAPDNKEEIAPLFIIQGTKLIRPAATSKTYGIRAHFVNIDPEKQEFEIALSYQNQDDDPPYIIMKAMIFPLINILWVGCVLLLIGSILATVKRVKDLKKSTID